MRERESVYVCVRTRARVYYVCVMLCVRACVVRE